MKTEYTVEEIDALRAAVECRLRFGRAVPGKLVHWGQPNADITGNVEETVRTHMLAGHTAEDLYKSDEQRQRRMSTPDEVRAVMKAVVSENPEPLTDELAELLLELLTAHFKKPVLPLPRFCAAMHTWFEAVRQRGEAKYASWLGAIETDIRKSNLLQRLLYQGEPLRTKECPLHKGRWDGYTMLSGCPHGCDGTGWLRE